MISSTTMAQRSLLLLLPFLFLAPPFTLHSLSNNNSQPPKKPLLRQIRSALAPFTLPCIYDVRPIQCETYPFWPSIVATRGDWEDEAVVPEEGVLREGTSDRYWTAELGGCEGILLDGGQHVKGMDGGNNDGEGVKVEVPIVYREEIVAKMKAAKKHWKRFPVEDIKQSTWYL
ncbi:hypothetical protein HJC23_012759 [Cyclotella cryptica]|uniref:Uncharacterized protein n=1 Tax=Cyclotella cryptica TaxID=29204 RepID=A0ABD3Q471_9STRA